MNLGPALFFNEHNFSVHAATSDRRVSPDQVCIAGQPWFRELSRYSIIKPELLFNMDEFFCTLDNNNRSWTWIRHKKGVPIQIAKSRIGCTVTVLASAEGRSKRAETTWVCRGCVLIFYIIQGFQDIFPLAEI